MKLAFAILFLSFVSPTFAAEKILKTFEGRLYQEKASQPDSENFTCELNGSSLRLNITIEHETQMLTVVLDQNTDFRGVATRVRYTEGSDRFLSYNLMSRGDPYSYEFSLVFNKTSDSVSATLVAGARAFFCRSMPRIH